MATLASKQAIKARYRVTGPRTEMVTYNKATIDPDTKSLIQETVTEEMETYMVYFPQGHSIRVTSFDKLKELGYHIKPKMVDMSTGEVVDFGGDPYDFGSGQEQENIILSDDEDLMPGRRKKPLETKE